MTTFSFLRCVETGTEIKVPSIVIATLVRKNLAARVQGQKMFATGDEGVFAQAAAHPLAEIVTVGAPAPRTSLVEQVFARARKNASRFGWDILLETMSEPEVRAVIGGAKTLRGAIAKCMAVLLPLDRQRAALA